ncbi:hypothetical protein SteCoe_23750 [Stentor coeruleus]|uniref:Uncharacterized protein n=1 Tax=Stentor coeruleus TaxID=5963 RepID=A0A1R2BJB4_9CILI|nr:hypothetical protein SteCoe_23750 [Stentor coeruleus]
MIEPADLEDLEDRLTVFQGLVEQLQAPSLSKAELEILMSQYTVLEDSIIKGIEFLSENLTIEKQDILVTLTHKYNELGCDFQDTWSDYYWSMYEFVRGGYEKEVKTGEISQQIMEAQDLALTLNRISKRSSIPTGNENNALLEVDELAKKYTDSTLIQISEETQELKKKKDCCSCAIY